MCLCVCVYVYIYTDIYKRSNFLAYLFVHLVTYLICLIIMYGTYKVHMHRHLKRLRRLCHIRPYKKDTQTVAQAARQTSTHEQAGKCQIDGWMKHGLEVKPFRTTGRSFEDAKGHLLLADSAANSPGPQSRQLAAPSQAHYIQISFV